jgi:hypothetical protein
MRAPERGHKLAVNGLIDGRLQLVLGEVIIW